ncbi:hypothetical protein C1Y40_05609 [Mycobacterium talmoniae]|uniref:Uncharacterized protein n=1 Tax=Mycobacterium talmoniae TaxID=1858794 RepID=A0A2S8BC60_9MYCO|nr:hypothetical protein C1Y40_05609 [Mycobacterium talmoniae]
MVKPIPETAPTPAMRGKSSPGARAAGTKYMTSCAAPAMPISLPTTRPSTTPQVMVEVTDPRIPAPDSDTPAFANAKTGTTT